MRYIYTENEPIERHPPRSLGERLVVINKKTGFPEVAIIREALNGGYILTAENYSFELSPHYWEIAWP